MVVNSRSSWEEWKAEEQRREESLPVCGCCKKRIYPKDADKSFPKIAVVCSQDIRHIQTLDMGEHMMSLCSVCLDGCGHYEDGSLSYYDHDTDEFIVTAKCKR